MAKCAACGTTILFGGRRDGETRYCNDECLQRGILLEVGKQIPTDMVQQCLRHVHRGPCPSCGGDGPVDVHMGYRVWSALLLTSWKNIPRVCCCSCGQKGRAYDILFSLVLGWWGFPWGFVMVPVQVGRNIAGMLRQRDPFAPSPELELSVRAMLAAQLLAAQAQQAGQQPS